MKRSFALFLVLILSCLLFVSCKETAVKYPAWKDTVELFGDGTYQIVRGNFEGKEQKSLSFSPAGVGLIPEVKSYCEQNGRVYLTGVDEGYYISGKKVSWKFEVYAVIDLSNNHIQICAVPEIASEYEFDIDSTAMDTGLITTLGSFSDFSTSDRTILETLQ